MKYHHIVPAALLQALLFQTYMVSAQCTANNIDSLFIFFGYGSTLAAGTFYLTNYNCGRWVSTENFKYHTGSPRSFQACAWSLNFGSVDPNFQGACSAVCLSWVLNNELVVQKGDGCPTPSPVLSTDTSVPTSSYPTSSQPTPFPTYTSQPTLGPTSAPITHQPTQANTKQPTSIPSSTKQPTNIPSSTKNPTGISSTTKSPAGVPTKNPTASVTTTLHPSTVPTTDNGTLSTNSPSLIGGSPLTSIPTSAPTAKLSEGSEDPRLRTTKSEGLSTGVVMGITLGSATGAALLVALCCFYVGGLCFKKRQDDDAKEMKEEREPASAVDDSKLGDTPVVEQVDWSLIGFLTEESDQWLTYVDRSTGDTFWVSTIDNMRFDSQPFETATTA